MNLVKVSNPEVVGWVLEDAEGNVWARPSRGSGAGSMCVWTTEAGAQREAAKLSGSRFCGTRGPWVVVRATLSLALTP